MQKVNKGVILPSVTEHADSHVFNMIFSLIQNTSFVLSPE